MNITRVFLSAMAACALFTSRAFSESLAVTLEPPKGGYTETKPDYLYFKEITAKRKSTKEITFTYVLQGKYPEKFPEGVGARYKVYFDIDGYDTKDSELTRGDFAEDIQVDVYQNPNHIKPRIFSQDRGYRAKDWSMVVTDLEIKGDKIELTVQSKLFAEPNLRVRMIFGSGRLTNDANGDAQDAHVHISPIYELPGRGKKPASGAISERLGG